MAFPRITDSRPEHRKALKHKFKKFRATDHPHRDYRGEKIIRGVKWRI